MPNFPTEFKEKEKVALICPNCNGCMNGIWRFYNHTFIHDPIQRFRCPTCNKRFAKVSEIGQSLISVLLPITKYIESIYFTVCVVNWHFSRGPGGC